MTNLTKNMTIAAAAVVLAAGVAGAQTINMVNADVPFAFRAAGTVMPAGEYQVRGTSGSGVLILKVTNKDTNRSVLTLPSAWDTRPAGETTVSLTFECTGADCALVRVNPGTGKDYRIANPKAKGDDGARLAAVRMVMVNGR